MVNTYAAQSGGCRFESLWGFGFSLVGAYYEVGHCGKKTFLAGLQCTLTSSCAKSGEFVVVIVYHQDDDQRTTVIVRKYRSSNVKCFVPSTVPMYHELKDLDPNLSVVAAEEFLATRVVVLRGNIGDCLISEVTKGFEHD